MLDRWRTARDCVAGSHAIKAAGQRYLPPLAGHEPRDLQGDYQAYLTRALFFNGTSRTLDSLVGMVFRREPTVLAPRAAAMLLDDIDSNGRGIEEFAKACLREVLTVGRVGILVDHTSPPSAPRPFVALYRAEAILDVVEEIVGGAPIVVQIRLIEQLVEPDPDQEFEVVEVEQVRVLELVEGIYQQRLFRRPGPGTMFEEVEVVVPTVDGARLDFIPFWIAGADETARPNDIEAPPLMDLIEVNLAHYRTEADYRSALHVAGVPTLFISGQSKPMEPLKVGSTEVQFLEQADAKAYYVSYGAEGAAAIRQALEDLLQMMAFLGARLLTPEKRGIEAAETARIHRMGEISVLAAVANGLSARLTEVLKLLLRWSLIGGSIDKVAVELNTDFLPTEASPQAVQQMLAALMAGKISGQDWWDFLQKGELVRPEKTWEDAQKEIEDEQGLLPAPTVEVVAPDDEGPPPPPEQ